MSPSRPKSRSVRPVRSPSHARRRHAPATSNTAVESFTVLEWGMLADALREHPHRLAVALHVARAAATGGKLTRGEEDEIVGRFAEILDEGIQRGGPQGGRRADENAFAASVWRVLVADSIRSPDGLTSPRCPAMAAMVPCPGEAGFVAALRRAAPGYVRTAIAGASAAELEELRALLAATDIGLEAYAPFAGPFGVVEHNSSDSLESAMATLARRHAQSAEICRAVNSYATGYAQIASEHAIPPVARIGLIAWLARVALHEPPPPPSHERPTGGVQ